MKYAQTVNKAVVVFLYGELDDWPDLRDAKVLQPCGEEVEIGWNWDGLTFAPPPIAIASRKVSSLEFRRRFTSSERSAITLAAAKGAHDGFSILQEWIDDLSAVGELSLDSADLREGMELLVHFGFLTDERVAVLLA